MAIENEGKALSTLTANFPTLQHGCARALIVGQTTHIFEKKGVFPLRFVATIGIARREMRSDEVILKKAKEMGAPEVCIITARHDGDGITITNIAPLHAERGEAMLEKFT